MASTKGSDEYSELNLSQLFDNGLQLHDDIQNSSEDASNKDLQKKIQKGIMMFEDATRLVSIMDIFSRNENYKEVQTGHLKYFLLPVILGDLNNRCLLTGRDRADIVETCQIYYTDFLQRMVDYEFTEINVPKVKLMKVDGGDEEAENNAAARPSPGRPNLTKSNNDREAMMNRFRETKELEAEIKTLKNLINPGTRDEELERKLFISMIKRFINFALDEIKLMHQEIDILRHMAAMKAGKIEPEPEKKSRPFQPIIITKDKLQKEVYGLGYPSLPVLSVDEFYEQRVKEGWWQPPGAGQSNSLQDKAKNPEEAKLQEEEHERSEDDKEDRDDEQTLMKNRAFDDWKDDHRRREGNRTNMG